MDSAGQLLIVPILVALWLAIMDLRSILQMKRHVHRHRPAVGSLSRWEQKEAGTMSALGHRL
jgi:hypothetical protein